MSTKSKYSFLINLMIFTILYHSSLSNPCKYKVARYQEGTNTTDANYLRNYNSDDSKKQRCFALSKSDVEENFCCFDKTNKLCVESSESSGDIECPVESKIYNNCGMASIYQPVTADRCTEISLVDGFCCFVKTKTNGNACIRQKDIDEDEKDAITDDIKNYVKNYISVDDIESVKCEGSLINNYLKKIMFLAGMIAFI